MANIPRFVLVACMRNEAVGLVEWLAHHLAIGFDAIVVYTNDCTDGTDDILRAVSAEFPVFQFDNPGPYEQGSIQKQALYDAVRSKIVRRAEWVLHIDADEFVNVTCGNRQIGDLAALWPDAHGIALLWRHFGDAGLRLWPGGSTRATFTRCEATPARPEAGEVVGFKTMLRPSAFGRLGVHHPKRPKVEDPVVLTAHGRRLPNDNLYRQRGSGFEVKDADCSWENGLIHHHHVRSADLHLLKSARGDANGRSNRKRALDGDYYRSVNRNEAEDRSILYYLPLSAPIEWKMRTLPGVAAAEARGMAHLAEFQRLILSENDGDGG